MKKLIILSTIALFVISCQQKITEGQKEVKNEIQPPKTEEPRANPSLSNTSSSKNKFGHERVYADMEVFEDKSASHHRHQPEINSEEYKSFNENDFISPLDQALSTFSIDVDRASYSNVRRYLQNGNLPPTDAVRIEEMINYFDYNYDTPKSDQAFNLNPQLIECPWNSAHQLLHLSLQAKKMETNDLPHCNLVFLIDVSGSMNQSNKLPLLKASFKMLVNNLRAKDRVAIVTYAGRSAVVLASTSMKEKSKILDALDQLSAGGSTAGAEGINTAYGIAIKNFIKDGNNRVILATDGDFNIGVSSEDGLEKLIEDKRKSNIYLSVLGYGMGNYKDNRMQVLAEKGNGNHAYIDNIQEANKTLVKEFGGTMFAVAKDVKIQIEFNPQHVKSYRLVGYESRMLNKEDFNNDIKDAGDMGHGHSVTAIYEIIPSYSNSKYASSTDPLKYQKNANPSNQNEELATIKSRYKKIGEDRSNLSVEIIKNKISKIDALDQNTSFSVAVAEFGLLLSNSKYIEGNDLDRIIRIARKSIDYDPDGYRAEFIRLVESVKDLDLLASR